MSAVMLDPITLDLANPWHDNFDKTTNQYPERVNARFEYMMHIVLLIFVGLAVVGIGLTFQGPYEKKEIVEEDENNDGVNITDMIDNKQSE